MDAVAQHKSYAPQSLGFAVVTVSDTRQAADDTSGERIRELATAAGHHVLGSALVRDEVAAIRQRVEGFLAEDEVDVIVLTGGTGFSPRDVTLPAVRDLFELEIDGFGELFRALSYPQVKAAAMLSRATAGLAQGKAIFVLPGSPKAVDLAMRELILPEAGHLLGQARRSASV